MCRQQGSGSEEPGASLGYSSCLCSCNRTKQEGEEHALVLPLCFLRFPRPSPRLCGGVHPSRRHWPEHVPMLVTKQVLEGPGTLLSILDSLPFWEWRLSHFGQKLCYLKSDRFSSSTVLKFAFHSHSICGCMLFVKEDR